jgi:hypothetical protein
MEMIRQILLEEPKKYLSSKAYAEWLEELEEYRDWVRRRISYQLGAYDYVSRQELHSGPDAGE